MGLNPQNRALVAWLWCSSVAPNVENDENAARKGPFRLKKKRKSMVRHVDLQGERVEAAQSPTWYALWPIWEMPFLLVRYCSLSYVEPGGFRGLRT